MEISTVAQGSISPPRVEFVMTDPEWGILYRGLSEIADLFEGKQISGMLWNWPDFYSHKKPNLLAEHARKLARFWFEPGLEVIRIIQKESVENHQGLLELSFDSLKDYAEVSILLLLNQN
jgi:hypothetical protein